MSTEAQKKASANYAKKMTKCVNLAFNKKTDADILEKLDQVDSKMGYIRMFKLWFFYAIKSLRISS